MEAVISGETIQPDRTGYRAQFKIVSAAAVILIAIILAYHWIPRPITVPKYAAMWVFALFFPVTAVLYLFFELNTRRSEIEDALTNKDLHFLYFPQLQDSEAREKFRCLVAQRFNQYYSPIELGSFALIAGAITLLSEHLIAAQLGLFADPTGAFPAAMQDRQVTAAVVASGFFGALSGSYALILRKYRAFDVYPTTYFQVTVGLIIGSFVAMFVAPMMAPSRLLMAPFFAIGFLVAKQIDYVVELLQHVLSSQRLPTGAAEVASDLPKLVCNPGAVESLSGLGLQSIGELAKATALTLYLNLPQPIGVINGWLDEALLHYYFENFMDRLRSVGIQRFTQLIDLLAPGLPTTAGTPRAPENVVWIMPEDTKITGASDDLIIARAVIGIVRSRTHHWTFAMIWDAYAEAFTRPQKEQEAPFRAAA